jgi:U11/U12 small nuclear ribonucleoprotein 35 kDa protein
MTKSKLLNLAGTDSEPHDQAIVRAINSKYHRNPNLKSNPKNTIFVTGLHNKTDEETLKNIFGRFGTILECSVISKICLDPPIFSLSTNLCILSIGDLVTGHSKYYGFIEFKHRDQARDAYHQMHRTLIDQSEISVEYEVGRVLKGWKPRRLGGGFGGKRESGQLRFGGRARPFVQQIGQTKKDRRECEL